MNPSKSKPKAGAQEAPEGLKRLEESFDKILSGHNAFQQNYLLVKEAKEWDMTLDEYRTLFESYCEHPSKRSLSKIRPSTLLRFWKWTGIAEKKLWDYFQLAATISIPIVVVLTGQDFTTRTNEKQQQIADEHYYQDLLSKYFDQMTDLITKEKLLVRNKGQSDYTTAPQRIARARTLSTLRELGKDGDRKGLLIKFLFEAKLILGKKPIVVLDSADIEGANLQGANLQGANLQGANLQGAILLGTNLEKANLQGAILEGAYLQYSHLNRANLNKANLFGANLFEADLNKANLQGANLNKAILFGANLFEACLKQVESPDPEQIKTSKNSEKAFYNSDFRNKQLRLSPDTRTPSKECY